MTQSPPFNSAAKTLETTEVNDTLITNHAISALVSRLDSKILASRDILALWLMEYVPLAYKVKENGSIDPQCQLVAEKLKSGVGYVKGYDYSNIPDQDNLPAKVFADTALVRTAESLSNGQPVHPKNVMGCLYEYCGERRGEGAPEFKNLEF